MNSNVKALRQEPTARNLLIGSMEPSLYEAANLATALAMAIQGMGKLAVEPEHETLALECLADEVRFAAHKVLEIWTKAHEVSA